MKRLPNILVTGGNGQLGLCLKDLTPEAPFAVRYLTRSELDLTDKEAIQTVVAEFSPEFIINCAAYTAVDKAEEEKTLAYAVNAHGAENLARAARDVGARLVHVSTDFVFDGEASEPYPPDARVNPLGVYGTSKQAGEEAIINVLPDQAMIIRTAWVYAEHGRNFVKTMLRLMMEKPELGVVADQVGSPTYARGLARLIWQIPEKGLFRPGIFHWTDAGSISWYGFACGIQEEALAQGLLASEVRINPISTSDYPTPARRP
ncbi:MAG: dTDP-4-dehydrorhamnose reductase, partial [Gammaproteobacteria bacterium]|nr:dTDP-4-dehydrorhamnose reductase [Gammaproteobacteria bacterium]